MLRTLTKSAFAQAVCHSRTARLAGRLSGAGGVPLVLGYHRVVKDFQAPHVHGIPPMSISEAMLGKHLDYVGRYYDFVSLDEIGDAGVSLRSIQHEMGHECPKTTALYTQLSSYTQNDTGKRINGLMAKLRVLWGK
jgi:hypothetical protein